MSHPSPAVPYASPAPGASPLWKLFRLGLILWASVTLLRHAFFWTNTLALTGGAPIQSMAFAAIECVLLVLILIAAIQSPRCTRNRFNVLGGLGGALVAVVVLGALADVVLVAFTPSSFLRVLWTFTARVQIVIFPLLCLLGLIRSVHEE